MDSLNSFFQDVVRKETSGNVYWKNIVYIFCNECGWTQKELEETEIPFIMDYLNTRNKVIAEENKRIKKMNKGK